MQNAPIPDALTDAIYRAALQVYRRHRDVMMGFASGDPHDHNTVPLSDLEDFKRDIEDELTVVLSEIVNQNVQYHDAAAVASAALRHALGELSRLPGMTGTLTCGGAGYPGRGEFGGDIKFRT